MPAEHTEVASRLKEALAPRPPILKVVPSVKGDKGDDGRSAYEVAVANGFAGTEAEWLESLHGKDGEDGKDADPALVRAEVERAVSEIELPQPLKGDPGPKGNDGKDAPAPKPHQWAFAVMRDPNTNLIREVIATPM